MGPHLSYMQLTQGLRYTCGRLLPEWPQRNPQLERQDYGTTGMYTLFKVTAA